MNEFLGYKVWVLQELSLALMGFAIAGLLCVATLGGILAIYREYFK